MTEIGQLRTFFKFTYFCSWVVCMWVHMDVWIHVLVCAHGCVDMCACVRLRLILGIFFSCSPSDVILRQELSLNLELDWPAREPQGIHLPWPPKRGYRSAPLHRTLMWMLGIWTQILILCSKRFTTESSPQTWHHYKAYINVYLNFIFIYVNNCHFIFIFLSLYC